MSPNDLKTFVFQVFMMIKTAQLHEPGNRAFQIPFEQFMKQLENLLNELGTFQLESIEMSLFINETKVRSDISTFGIFRFLDELFKVKDIGGIRFLKVPSSDEAATVFKSLQVGQGPSGAEGYNQILSSRGFDSIEFLPRTQKRTVAEDEKKTVISQKKRALKNYAKAIDTFKNIAASKPGAQSVESRKAKRIVYDLVDICLDEGFSFVGLASIKNYDEYTFNHSVNVCVLSIGFGKNLGLTKRQLGELGVAGLYHDYGKTDIPLNILNKPAKFSPDEWEVMKLHPIRSIKRLLDTKGGFQSLDIKKMIAAFEHHRNYDCTGYPQTGVKKKLNFYSSVVAIADAYDAMTTNRVYQRGMLPTIALKILSEHSGTKFDPILVKAFINTVGVYPVGSLVKLNNGTMAVVVDVSKVPDKVHFPIIRIVTNESGQQIENGQLVNLAENSQGITIENALHPDDHHINVAHYMFGDALQPGT